MTLDCCALQELSFCTIEYVQIMFFKNFTFNSDLDLVSQQSVYLEKTAVFFTSDILTKNTHC